MESVGRQYRAWVAGQRLMGAAPTVRDDSHLWFELPTVTAQVNFYPYEDKGEGEIVELLVVRASDGDSTFFLHFALDDLARAKELFGQLAEALANEESDQCVHILLSCTSALTTSLFAAKMNDVAQALKLGYDFEAMSIGRALATEGDYGAIMLAPQAAHMRKAMAEAHPDALVFEIPGKVFGAYDAPAAIRLLMHAMREVQAPGASATPLRAVRDLSDNRRILAITYFALNGRARLGWRLYDHGIAQAERAIRNQAIDYRQIGDLIQNLSLREIDLSTLDAIGIAVPGVTRRGMVSLPDFDIYDFDLGLDLTERFGIPVYVDNNCNAAAVGCYVSQHEVENLVFYRHAFGHPAGGIGTVIDGRILKGRKNLAGEPRFFGNLFSYDKPIDEASWSAEGLQHMARCVALSIISLISPEALYLAVDTVDDADEFAASLAETMGPEYVPQIHLVDDYVERVYLGTLAMALQKLRDPAYRSHGVGKA